MIDSAIVDAVRFAGEQSEITPWATPEEIAHVLGVSSEDISQKLRDMAANGLLSIDFGWHNTANITLPNIQHPTVGYNKNEPRFRVL